LTDLRDHSYLLDRANRLIIEIVYLVLRTGQPDPLIIFEKIVVFTLYHFCVHSLSFLPTYSKEFKHIVVEKDEYYKGKKLQLHEKNVTVVAENQSLLLFVEPK
jgi:hypothetical protein